MSFEESHPQVYNAMALAMKEYAKYVTELEAGEETGGTGAATVAARQRRAQFELEHNPQGFPILPEIEDENEEEELEYQKRLIRTFLTDHYSRLKWS